MPFPVSEPFVARAEQDVGRMLPEGLRNRLMQDNGGMIAVAGGEWSLHPVWDDSDRRRIARTANHVVRETAQAWHRHGFPPDAVSVAKDGYGNHLVLLPGSDEIWFWDHETGLLRTIAVDWD
jgi:SMI1 / KNR4 family (SUKH-1)